MNFFKGIWNFEVSLIIDAFEGGFRNKDIKIYIYFFKWALSFVSFTTLYVIEIDIGFLISESLEDIICSRKERKILGLLDLTFPFVLSFE